MAKNGLLIDYNYCTGCHSCEIACQQEHDFPAGKNGIIVTEHLYENFTQAGSSPTFRFRPTFVTSVSIATGKVKILLA
ncbi:hypothetical protein ACFL0H_15530 [Thermodesulfobacteriota bacterium]